MLKIFSTAQVRRADAYTIENEPISSNNLMERAAKACVDWLTNFPDFHSKQILVFCGPGNNGGDGLAIARMLSQMELSVHVFIPDEDEKVSADFAVNFEKIIDTHIHVQTHEAFDPASFTDEILIIDALFGSGLSKPLEGKYKELVERINNSSGITIAIDIPSGIYADKLQDLQNVSVIKADYTMSFEFPKLAFLQPENELYIGEWHILPIGLHEDFIQSEPCENFLIEQEDIKLLIKPRLRFSHKGNNGHALLIGGSKGKMGAAVLMSKACLRAGAGLVTVHIPAIGYDILQTSVPEIMVSVDEHENECGKLPKIVTYSAIGTGPGLGTIKSSSSLLKLLIQESKSPLILDADALNILAENPTWLEFLKPGTILTPHPGEFARLAGKISDSFMRLEVLRAFCIRHQVYTVLKGAYTVTCTPSGNCYFNPSGNPGMATAGSGDVLTGIITGLLAQGYMQVEACIIGTYIHGLAGDIALTNQSYESLIAGDIIENLGKAFSKVKNEGL